MTLATHIPSAQMLDMSRAWRTLTTHQQELDRAGARAWASVALDRLSDEDPDRIHVAVEERPPCVVLHVTLTDVSPDALRAWVTPDLVLLRGATTDGRTVERLVRLPAPVEREGFEIDREGQRFVISLERRSAVPTPLWSPVTA